MRRGIGEVMRDGGGNWVGLESIELIREENSE